MRCHLLVDQSVRLPPMGAFIEPRAFMQAEGPASSPELASSVEHKMTDPHKGCSNYRFGQLCRDERIYRTMFRGLTLNANGCWTRVSHAIGLPVFHC